MGKGIWYIEEEFRIIFRDMWDKGDAKMGGK